MLKKSLCSSGNVITIQMRQIGGGGQVQERLLVHLSFSAQQFEAQVAVTKYLQGSSF